MSDNKKAKKSIEEVCDRIVKEAEDLYGHKMKNRNGYKHFRTKRQCIVEAFARHLAKDIPIPAEKMLTVQEIVYILGAWFPLGSGEQGNTNRLVAAEHIHQAARRKAGL